MATKIAHAADMRASGSRITAPRGALSPRFCFSSRTCTWDQSVCPDRKVRNLLRGPERSGERRARHGQGGAALHRAPTRDRFAFERKKCCHSTSSTLLVPQWYSTGTAGAGTFAGTGVRYFGWCAYGSASQRCSREFELGSSRPRIKKR